MTATVKAYKGMGMEGSTARWYDRTTRKDMPEIKALAQRIASALSPAAQVLEVAPGPGFLSIELAKRGLHVRAVDISKTFVEIAQTERRCRGRASALRPGERGGLARRRCQRRFRGLPCGLQKLYRAGEGAGRISSRAAARR